MEIFGKSLHTSRLKLKHTYSFTATDKFIGFFVIKRDGSRQAFDREKIVSGVTKSFDKRPVSIDLIRQLADEAFSFTCVSWSEAIR